MSTQQRAEAQKYATKWKSEGFEKCDPNKLSWNDEVRIIYAKLVIFSGKVCKVYPNEDYFLIVDGEKQFKRIYFDKLIRLYRKKFQKPKRDETDYQFHSDDD